MYDLMFSKRRQTYEESRIHIYNDITRRHGIKYARRCAKEGKPLCLQNIVDIYVCNRERLRPVSHLFQYSAAKQKAICRRYATIIFNVWARFASSMSRRVTFDAAAAALLYHMRRGLAFDGMNVVPMDAFLFNSLPGKLLRCPCMANFLLTSLPFACNRCTLHQRRRRQPQSIHTRKERVFGRLPHRHRKRKHTSRRRR